jgi:hypothetical protein
VFIKKDRMRKTFLGCLGCIFEWEGIIENTVAVENLFHKLCKVKFPQIVNSWQYFQDRIPVTTTAVLDQVLPNGIRIGQP